MFTSDIRATCHRAAHGRFLTPFFECETEVKSAALSSSKYCICGGPSKQVGFETLTFTICGSCKKEKQP